MNNTPPFLQVESCFMYLSTSVFLAFELSHEYISATWANCDIRNISIRAHTHLFTLYLETSVSSNRYDIYTYVYILSYIISVMLPVVFLRYGKIQLWNLIKLKEKKKPGLRANFAE